MNSGAREHDLQRPSDRHMTGSNLCPICQRYGKGPITYQDGRIVYRHMVKVPGHVGKQINLCELRPRDKAVAR